MKSLLLFMVLIITTTDAEVNTTTFTHISPYRDTLKYTTDQSRIANGYAANANQFPYQVSILSPVLNGFQICGGSLISRSWVLTTAHCTVQQTQFIVRLGSLNLVRDGVALVSFTTIIHPSYNPSTLNSDISLIALPSAVTLSTSIYPIRLPRIDQIYSSFLDYRGTVSGWGEVSPGSGVQELLRWVYMRVISNNQCATVYGSIVVVDHVMCALGYTSPNNQGHCGGDSGGPLVISEGGIPTQIGIASFAASTGCDVGLPSGYMRMSHFIYWINGVTGIALRP